MGRRRVLAVVGPIAIGVLVALLMGSHHRVANAALTAKADDPQPTTDIKHDKSAPLSTIPPKKAKKKKKIRPEHRFSQPPGSVAYDPVVQDAAVALAAPTTGPDFGGISAVDSLPPDPNAAVGQDQIVEIANQSFQVFSKTGGSLYGPAATNTLWTGFGGDCEDYDDGDGTVAYDRIANRWVIQQFAIEGSSFLECIAVSATSDATGSWYRYAFGGFGSNFPDYPKLGVWPDGYYVTFNLFSDYGWGWFIGPEVCAYDRSKMLLGLTAKKVCKTAKSSSLNGLLPSDFDGSTLPPNGSPNYLLGLQDTGIREYRFKMNWKSTSKSKLSGPYTVAGVLPFNLPCDGTGADCVPQKGTSDVLDTLGDRLMYRLAYRNFGDHESLVVTHTVAANGAAGMRWYEIRTPGATPTVYQQGTYAPADAKWRWMGSAAMDGTGDIALGYSISSPSMYPSIAYTGRLVGDSLGTMTQGETIMQAGGGSQISDDRCDPFSCSLRWGDYTSMSIDPTDDCTFWYTGEYLPSDGNFNWTTRIGSFTLPGCVPGGTGTGGGGTGGGSGSVSNDFSLKAGSTSFGISRGGSKTIAISATVTSGVAEAVALSASGQPAGVAITFTPTSITPGSTTSTMGIQVGSSTAIGTYPVTVTGTSASTTHSVVLSMTVK